jgi:hypothetical protein
MLAQIFFLSELRKIWDEVFLAEKASADQVEVLRQLRGKYNRGGWQQDHVFGAI